MRSLEPDLPPSPWNKHTVASAAGIFAGGWTYDNQFVMLTSDGYSIHEPITGTQILFDQDADVVFSNLSDNSLSFLVPSKNYEIQVFGVSGGDGVHKVNDWFVKTIYPWWPNSMVVLYRNSLLDKSEVFALSLDVCDYGSWIKCGFSPSGTSLAVLGHAGADFFSIDER